MTFNPEHDPTPPLTEFIEWLDENPNNWIRAGDGHLVNALEEAADRLNTLNVQLGSLRASLEDARMTDPELAAAALEDTIAKLDRILKANDEG